MNLDSLFKFKVGDWVRLRQDRPDSAPALVVERTLQQCYAAHQCHYHLRVSNGSLVLFSELELEPSPPPGALSNVEGVLKLLKSTMVNEHDFEGAADVRDFLDRLTKKRGNKDA